MNDQFPCREYPIAAIVAGLFLGFALLGCSSSPVSQSSAVDQPVSVGILIFGDSGYHLDYPDQDDFEDLFSEEQYLQKEWDDWVEDMRPEDEFEARPSAMSPVTGMTVTATGMDAISTAMKSWCANNAECDFGVMLGDNIYPSGATFGEDGQDDADRFNDILEVPFGNLVPDDPDYRTYVTLGNHDWESSRAGGFSQIGFLEQTDTFYMDGAFFSVKPPAGNGDIELFVIDTSMMLASTTVFEDILDENGAEVATDEVDLPDYFVEPMTRSELDMAAWLERALRESDAKWKIVVGHHPIWSSSGSKFEQARALRKMILPIMCRYADVYMVGHEHTLEIHTDDCSTALGEATPKPLVQILSGAASKQRPLNTNFMRYQEQKYPQQTRLFAEGLLWGFAHMQIEGNDAKVRLLSIPDDGSSASSVIFEYEFEHRSMP